MTRIEWAVEQSRGISIPCPSYDEAFIHVQEWVPAAEELRQAGAAILQPDGTFYALVDGKVAHIDEDGNVIDAPQA